MDPKPSHQLRQKEQEELLAQQQTASQAGLEFATPDEALRYDASQTAVPATIEERLQQSLEKEPAQPKSSWWHRLFNR